MLKLTFWSSVDLKTYCAPVSTTMTRKKKIKRSFFFKTVRN